MPHLVLLGDSVLDNGSYTAGGPAVIELVRRLQPDGWRTSMGAVDGSTTLDIPKQLAALPPDATHLVLSVGGNDALGRASILDEPAACAGDALLLLDVVVQEFEENYRRAIYACLHDHLTLVLCTIYHGNFPDPRYQRMVSMALTLFNDVIIRVAMENSLRVLDLRAVCNSPEDYASPIEPSSIGGAKIAETIIRAVSATCNPEMAQRTERLLVSEYLDDRQ